ncbi:MipA/OmpV family protein [Pararhizobium haloflavum]|uniref:MipA/OmpV family protein n=1 Tax=Pararhizobium haloflavum TaxID=2037914 RepID=UPI000C1920CD|nr:MipA/OmpV family protein [Pararhizobium haloflavum]
MAFRYFLTFSMASLVLLAGPGRAADQVAPAPPPQPAESPLATQPGFGIVVGGLGFVTPAYEGSDEYRVTGFPLVYPKFHSDGEGGFGSRVSIKGPDDVRFALLRQGGFDAGPVVGYTFGRDEDDADLLRGLGDLDGGLLLGAYGGYRLEPFFFDAVYQRQVSGQDDAGYQIKLEAGTKTMLSDRLDLRTSLGTSYASDDYMGTFFGITPAQSAASGLSAYEAEGGFKSVGIDLEMNYQLTDRAGFKASAGYSRLIGDAADSPITASRDQFRGGIGLSYTFGAVR